MSMGYLVGENAPVVWRGLMVTKAIQQLLFDVDWGGLDVLVLDLPPGTGDAQLTITQMVNLAGAVIVSTPQDVALKDAIKGIGMFKEVKVPVGLQKSLDAQMFIALQILGMVQNMSVFICPHCQTATHLFGAEGVKRTCAIHEIDFLGSVPLHASICEDTDRGKPTMVSEPESPRGQTFMDLSKAMAVKIGL